MKRKMNNQLRKSIFESVAAKLVHASLDAYSLEVNDFLVSLYERKYKKHMKKIKSLPRFFFHTTSRIKIEGISFPEFKTGYISSTFYPTGKTRYSWVSLANKHRMNESVIVPASDQYKVSIDFDGLPVTIKKKAKALKKKGVSLEEKTTQILNELRELLNSCATVTELRKSLPEFGSLYPSDEVDQLPVFVPSADNLKKEAEKFAATA